MSELEESVVGVIYSNDGRNQGKDYVIKRVLKDLLDV